MNIFEFNSDDTVSVETLHVNKDIEKLLFQNLLIFFTGSTRSASRILQSQEVKNKNSSNDKLLQRMVDLVRPFKEAMFNKDLLSCGEILHENWRLKKGLAASIANSNIDSIYEAALNAGAIGGKLLGAGGSGFMVFLVAPEKHENVLSALSKLRRVHWDMDVAGSTIVYRS